ncbi:MAG: cyclic nucleotide-binding/CBS domain-containing protein [Deltaproteobacteria bacterium]|nr:cyclic nucleotide-binding/CBS domain-containing protein [Deltaproteobacteria bacterium]
MASDEDSYSPPLTVIVKFLQSALPFNSLDSRALYRLARLCRIDFFPQGTIVFQQGISTVDYLYLIQQGGVKSYLKDADDEISLNDYRGRGEYFGALPIIQNTRANLNVETVEDTFCFLISKDDFLQLLARHREFSQYFLRTMSAKMVKNVYAEFRQHKISTKTESGLYLFSATIGKIAKGRLFTIPAGTAVREAAVIMSEKRIGSLLVTDNDGKIIGIVTDRDIRSKVVARGLVYQTDVAEIMTAPVQTISSQAVCFDAILQMMKKRVHHLAVEQGGEIVRMITTHDIMVTQGTSPLYLFREIGAQRRVSGLYDLSAKIYQVVRSLIEEGAKANNITRMIAVLNDHILEKMLSLLLEEYGAAPLPFCWLLMGSEGRREQTFKTDQDNAILYADSDDEVKNLRAAEFFRSFGEAVIGHLVKCGYPLCPGDIMASNPKWRQPLAVWKGYFRAWCRTPTPESVLNSTIFFDFKAEFGAVELAAELRSEVLGYSKREDLFLMHMARNCLASRPPLSFFKNFVVEKDGRHKDTFDLKRKGMVFFVDFARLLSLKYGVDETNTMARLQVLGQGGYIPESLGMELVEAYEFLMQVRLVHQLHQMDGGHEPDNYIKPGDLSDLERQTLKEAFAVISRLQEFIKQEFHLAEL